MDARPETPVVSGHELVDHTSEVVVRIWASDFPALIQEATRAFAEMIPPSISLGPAGEPRTFEVEGRDRAALLVEWLNELVYLCEAELWLPVEVRAEERPGGLSVRVRGMTLSEPFVLVKAATLHGAKVLDEPGGPVAEVTLDI